MTNDRDLWAELYRIDAKYSPRLGTEWGLCGVCRLPATGIRNFGGTAYGLCHPCKTRWPITWRQLHVDRESLEEAIAEALGDEFDELSPARQRALLDVELDEIEYSTALDLARRIEVPAFNLQGQPGESQPMKNRSEAPAEIDLAGRAKTLEQHITTLEALVTDRKPGGAELLERARASYAELLDDAIGAMFPRQLTPTTEATHRDFTLLFEATATHPFERCERSLAGIHETSIDGHPELAAFIRGPRGQALVRLHALRAAAGDVDALPYAEQTALAVFVQLIAVQLRNRGLCLPAAALVTDTLPGCQARITAAVEQLRAIEAAEKAAREEAEARAREAAEAVKNAEEQKRRAERLRSEGREGRDRRESLARYYKNFGAFWRFEINGIRMNGDQASAELLGGANYLEFFKGQYSGQRVRR